MTKLRAIAAIAALLAVAAFSSVGAWQLATQPRLAGRALSPLAKKSEGTLDQAQGLLTRVNGTLDKMNNQLDAQSENLQANGEAMTVMLNQASQLVMDTRVQLLGGKGNCRYTGRKTPGGSRELVCEDVAGLLPQANALVAELGGAVRDARKLLDGLSDPDSGLLAPLRASLENIAGLTAQLDEQVQEGGPDVRRILVDLDQAIRHFDTLLADENIQKTIAHVEGSTESIDIALRPWRKKASQLKMILEKVAGALKIVWKL